MRIQNAVVVITGASSGIGAALAQMLAREGARLVLAARRTSRLEQLADALDASRRNVIAVTTDVTVRSQAEHLIEQTLSVFGRIDVLVNNAGRGHMATIEETEDDIVERIFAVNTFALWRTTRPALRAMKKQGCGHIITVASMAGKAGFPLNSAYVAAKHAAVGFSRALRMELLETGIHASVICPGGVETEWAGVTEGGAMAGLFSEAGPAIARIEAELGEGPSAMEQVISADRVADAIRNCMLSPKAEVYTHRGSREFAALVECDPEAAERQRLPFVIAEREAYARLRKRG
jgi:short-subunit dehydrogenase